MVLTAEQVQWIQEISFKKKRYGFVDSSLVSALNRQGISLSFEGTKIRWYKL